MVNVFDEGRTRFTLGEKLASGGEGVIWKIKGSAEFIVKIYHQRPDAEFGAKLRALRGRSNALKKFSMLPVSLAYADADLGTQIGIFLPFAAGHDIHQLYGPRSRFQHFPSATFKFLIRAAYNLAAAFEEIHGQEIIIGDISEQNIKVLGDATVRIIDCDSFQITTKDRTYTSNVGTPIWTAPELHGINLNGLVRTKNHDRFGLAQLIFLLLFGGRYPFAGRPRTNRHLPPEEAIKEHAFAFAPDYLNIPLLPPPGCPRLNALPPNIQKAFLRSFLSDSVRPDGRPAASEWRRLLAELDNELVACQHNSNHHFWRGASACPWCESAAEVGVDLFPSNDPILVFPGLVGGNKHRKVPIPHPFSVTFPPINSNLQPSSLPPEPSGAKKLFGSLFSSKGWKYDWLKRRLNELRDLTHDMEAKIQQLQIEQKSLISTYRSNFSILATELQGMFDDLNQPSKEHQKQLTEYAKTRRASELSAYLKRFGIREHKIHQIGPARQATLLSFGIETAFDISDASLSRADLPYNATYSLKQWKKSFENRFMFDPSKALSQSEHNEVNRLTAKAHDKTRTESAALEIKISSLTAESLRKFRDFDGEIRRIAAQRDQALVDFKFCQSLLKG